MAGAVIGCRRARRVSRRQLPLRLAGKRRYVVYGAVLSQRTEFEPTARTAAIPGAGHWVAYEAADPFNAVLARFLAPDRPAG